MKSLLLQSDPSDDEILDSVELENNLHERMFLSKSEVIEYCESCIDPSRPVYLFTWSPDPRELPDADFETQHEWCLETVSKYLLFCLSGCACVEANAKSNPHYHGWYQLTDNPVLESKRIAMMKSMQHYAPSGFTVEKAVNYKINDYYEHRNSLYYYKKDMYTSMFLIQNNPVTRHSISNINWNEYLFFFKPRKGRISTFELEKKISNRAYFEKYYQNSRL